MLLYEIVDVFEEVKLKYAIVGGYALALHGLVRATIDVDLVLNLRLSDFELAEKALLQIGLQSRIPVRAQDIIKMRKEYIERRNLIAWFFVDFKNFSRQVDFLITKDLRKLATEIISVGGKKIKVVTLEELLKTKRKTSISPEEAVHFLEDMRVLSSAIDEPTVPISLRIPANVLRTLKLKAKADGKKYQSLIVGLIRKGLLQEVK